MLSFSVLICDGIMILIHPLNMVPNVMNSLIRHKRALTYFVLKVNTEKWITYCLERG